MSFRSRKTARLGPLRFNFAVSGLSSISVAGRNGLAGPRAGAPSAALMTINA